MTVRGPESFVSGYPATNPDGLVNVVVEIPAGTNAKWEVDKRDGALRWEIRDGQPRVVKFLGYPANYGMVPSTLLPKELGGDGDPLDVLLLGPAQPRGTVARARLLGVLKLLDRGEQDDKLIALLDEAPITGVASLAELDDRYPGVTQILEIWMTSYKGPGVIRSGGYAGADEANAILEAAMRAYQERGAR
jgi:inorganic pyrophosphatase